MVITPELPAKAGYVEIETSDGKRVYAPTQETIDRQNTNKDITTTIENIAVNKSDADEQLLNIQLALCELYENNDKQLTDLQTALCEVYELVLREGTV